MRKLLYLFLVFILAPKLISAQGLKLDFLKHIGGTSEDQGTIVKTDAQGNIYAAGIFKSTVDFDPDTGSFELTSPNYPTQEDIYLAKYDKSGKFLWAINIGGDYGDNVGDIAIDTSGIYMTGAFSGRCDFDPGAGKYELSSYGTQYDIFVAKYSSSGKFIWAIEAGNDFEFDEGKGIALDPSGNVYATGHFAGTTDFDPGSGTFNLSSVNGWDAFVLKLSSSGKFIWAKSFGDVGTSIQLDNSGNVYTIGSFKDYNPTDFDPGSGVYNIKSKTGDYYDIFISKLNSSGNFQWAIAMGDKVDDVGYDLVIDKSNNIYSCGYFNGTVDFDPGTDTINLRSGNLISAFIAKYDSLGKLVWASKYSGTSTVIAKSIQLDEKQSIYTTGTFQGSSDFNPGNGTAILKSLGSGDIFIAKLDSLGNYEWAKRMGGSDNDIGACITIDKAKGIYLTGSFKGKADMNPHPQSTYLTSKGAEDIFLYKMTAIDCQGNSNTVNINSCNSFTSPSGKYKWTSSGTYKDTIVNDQGCDSFLTINLIIKNRTYGTAAFTVCNSYVSPSKRFVWSVSGTYKDTIPNSKGCDSFITINLNVKTTTYSTLPRSACNSYTSPSKRYIWTSSGTYKDTIINKKGCDSIITVNLTINKATYSILSAIACDFYNSPSKKFKWILSGAYKDTLKNKKGCDSILTINLTINKTDISVINNSPTLVAKVAGATYQWLDCKAGYSPINGATKQSFTALHNGDYAVKINLNGCTDTSACIQVLNASFRKTGVEYPILVYPNPTDGEVWVQLGNVKGQTKAIILNSIGEVISSKEISSSPFKLQLEGGTGLYVVNIITNEQKSTFFKVLKY